MARPKKNINTKTVKRMARRMCTHQEIADAVGCSVRTIRRRYGRLIAKSRACGQNRLRFLQWQRAEKGSDRMLIHMGKQYLSQADKIDAKVNTIKQASPLDAYRRDPELLRKALELGRLISNPDAICPRQTSLSELGVSPPSPSTRRDGNGDANGNGHQPASS